MMSHITLLYDTKKNIRNFRTSNIIYYKPNIYKIETLY